MKRISLDFLVIFQGLVWHKMEALNNINGIFLNYKTFFTLDA